MTASASLFVTACLGAALLGGCALGGGQASRDGTAHLFDKTGEQELSVVVTTSDGRRLLLLLALRHRTCFAAAMPAVLGVGQVLETVMLSALPRTPPGLVSWSSLSSGRTATAVLGWGLVALVLAASGRRAVAVGAQPVSSSP